MNAYELRRDPRINMAGGPLSIQALESILFVLQVAGECKIENCGEVSPMRLAAELIETFRERPFKVGNFDGELGR